MTIKVGDRIPDGALVEMTAEGPKPHGTKELFGGRKVVVLGLPGAFTPTCSAKHLPGFIENADAIKAKGVDAIACVSVNDPFVMGAWARDQGSGDKVTLLADGSAAFTKACGLDFDLGDRGLGVRSKRYSMVVEDGVVTRLNLEPDGGGLEVSDADTILGQL